MQTSITLVVCILPMLIVAQVRRDDNVSIYSIYSIEISTTHKLSMLQCVCLVSASGTTRQMGSTSRQLCPQNGRLRRLALNVSDNQPPYLSLCVYIEIYCLPTFHLSSSRACNL